MLNVDRLADLEREQIERKESEAIINGYKRQLASAKEKCAAVEVEIQQYGSSVAGLRSEKTKERRILESQAQRADPTIELLEHALGFSMHGVQRAFTILQFTWILTQGL